MRRFTRAIFLILGISFILFSSPSADNVAKGIVFEDVNRNLALDPGEKGVPGVMVSNQRDVVLTDAQGRYQIPVGEETVIFITKPAAYAVPLDAANLAKFYYIHQPQGSPPRKYAGVKPTGPLPENINFPLFEKSEQDTFEAVVFGDPQPAGEEQIVFMQKKILSSLVGAPYAFAIALGDEAFDDLNMFDRYIAAMAPLGFPVYNVPGNHDTNRDQADNRYSLETFKSKFGPSWYSFDQAKAHFVMLYDIRWYEETVEGKTKIKYKGMFGQDQLVWLANDLQYVPKDKLVVLAMHIALKTVISESDVDNVVDRVRLFDLLKDREHVLVLAGHNHTMEHHFLGQEYGWKGNTPLHQIICCALCGAWWGGPKDELGIPCAIEQDGTPNGYYVFRFEGNKYSERFIPAMLPRDYQIRISAPPDKIPLKDLHTQKIVANIFDGSERSKVVCRVDQGHTFEMTRTIMKDPFFEDLYSKYKDLYPSWLSPIVSNHIWVALMPPDLKPGFHTITVETKDQFGQEYKSCLIFEILQE